MDIFHFVCAFYSVLVGMVHVNRCAMACGQINVLFKRDQHVNFGPSLSIAFFLIFQSITPKPFESMDRNIAANAQNEKFIFIHIKIKREPNQRIQIKLILIPLEMHDMSLLLERTHH